MRKKCFIGFDGYRDEIYRLIKRRTKEGYEFWDKMEDLGSYLQNNCGKRSDIESVSYTHLTLPTTSRV